MIYILIVTIAIMPVGLPRTNIVVLLLVTEFDMLVGQLNHLPVSTDSLRTRNRKRQIEEELDKIEAAITIFSREKVFVKASNS